MPEASSDRNSAQTILAVSMDLMSADAPVPTARLKSRHFAGLSPDAARKGLSRAKDALVACGLIISEHRTKDGIAWSVDPACYPEDTGTPKDALLIHLLAEPLLSDSGFPHRADLRFALMKLGGTPTFAGVIPNMVVSHAFETVLACLDACLLVEFDYTDAQGNESHRTAAPLGLFDLRGHSYLVCSMGDINDPSTYRTLRCDRISSASRTNVSFSPPVGFDVNDYRLLPFQLGPTVASCTFRLPEGENTRFVEATLGEGRIYERDGICFWDVPASDLRDAATWAIAHDLHPVGPPELVDAWRELLRGCLA